MAEHSPARILQVRAKLYDLLSHCIPATTILKVRVALLHLRIKRAYRCKTLTFKLIPKIDDALKKDVIKWSAFYEHRIRMGSVGSLHSHAKMVLLTHTLYPLQKVIFHLEAFVAKFMRVVER